jgi:hypothetical protein
MEKSRRIKSIAPLSASLSLFLGVLSLCAVVVASESPWNSKPADQWGSKDIAAILQSSPWCRVNQTAVDASHRVDMTAVTSPASLYSAGDEVGATPSSPADYITNAALGMDSTTYGVVWLSSRTMRAALARAAVLRGQMTQDEAERIVRQQQAYQVLVTGPKLQLLHGRDGNAWGRVAYLQVDHEKNQVHPNRVNFLRDSKGAVAGMVFYFPKLNSDTTATVPANAKGVAFRLILERAIVYVGFEPQKMVDRQGADL